MIALYERVSTEEQAQSGFSLDAQKERLEAFCKSQGWSDFEHFTDDGYSGTNMDRPALQRLIRYAERKQIEAVVVYKLDRLSRKQREVLYLLEEVFDANGVAFRSTTEPFDTSSPLGRAMLGILAVFGQLERDTIIERTKFGLRQRARRGLWPSASVPFGYRMNSEGVLEAVSHEAELVRAVFDKFIKGESRMSIASWLSKRITNRYVDHYFILNMLRRKTYLGKIELSGEEFDGKHAPIIDELTFSAAQRELKSRLAGKGSRGTHLLSHLMTCGNCGASVHYFTQIQRRKSGKEYRYTRVQCEEKKKSPDNCQTHSFLAKEIESQVIDVIRSLNLEDMLAYQPDQPDHSQVIDDLEQSLQKNKEQQNRLLDAVQDGTLPHQMVKERLAELEREQQAILAQMDDSLQRMPSVDTDLLSQTLSMVNDVWDDMSSDEQKSAIRLLLKRVTVFPDKHVEVEWNV